MNGQGLFGSNRKTAARGHVIIFSAGDKVSIKNESDDLPLDVLLIAGFL